MIIAVEQRIAHGEKVYMCAKQLTIGDSKGGSGEIRA
jgi:hypothetical protein